MATQIVDFGSEFAEGMKIGQALKAQREEMGRAQEDQDWQRQLRGFQIKKLRHDADRLKLQDQAENIESALNMRKLQEMIPGGPSGKFADFTPMWQPPSQTPDQVSPPDVDPGVPGNMKDMLLQIRRKAVTPITAPIPSGFTRSVEVGPPSPGPDIPVEGTGLVLPGTNKEMATAEAMQAEFEKERMKALTTPYDLSPGQQRRMGSDLLAENTNQPTPAGVLREWMDVGAAAYAESLGKTVKELTPKEAGDGYREFATQRRTPVPGTDVPLSPEVEAQRTRMAQERGTAANNTDAKDIAEAIISGTQPPVLTGLYRNGGPVRAELARRGYDLATAQRDWTAVQKHLATLNSNQQERLRQAITFTHDSVDIIEDLYDQWKQAAGVSGFKVLNRATLATMKQLPGDAGSLAQNLEAQINDLTSEMATVYKGGNSSTDEGLRLAAENLKADWNEATFGRALTQIRKNLEIRKNSIMSSQPAGVSQDSPYMPEGQNGGQPVSSGRGATGVSQQYPEGTVISDGKSIKVLRGGQWVNP